MSPTQELYEAIEALLKHLQAELISVVRERDIFSARAMEIEERLRDVARLEQQVRKMP